MKATIYTREGNVVREVDCTGTGVEPYMGDFVQVVGSDIYTNMPVEVQGEHPEWNEMLKGSQVFDLTWTVGKKVKKFEGARALILHECLTSFWHDGEWHSVSGQVIVENMREGGPVEIE